MSLLNPMKAALPLAIAAWLLPLSGSAQHECNREKKTFSVAFTCAVSEPQKCREAKLLDADKKKWFCLCPAGQTGCEVGSADIVSGGPLKKDTEIEVFVPGSAAPAPGTCKIKTLADVISDKPYEMKSTAFTASAGTVPPCPEIKDPAVLNVIIKSYTSQCTGTCE